MDGVGECRRFQARLDGPSVGESMIDKFGDGGTGDGKGEAEGESAVVVASVTISEGSCILGEVSIAPGSAGTAGSSSESDSSNHWPADCFSGLRGVPDS